MLRWLIIFDNDLLLALYISGVSSVGCFIRFHSWNYNFFIHILIKVSSDWSNFNTIHMIILHIWWRLAWFNGMQRLVFLIAVVQKCPKAAGEIWLVILFLRLKICFFYHYRDSAYIFLIELLYILVLIMLWRYWIKSASMETKEQFTLSMSLEC